MPAKTRKQRLELWKSGKFPVPGQVRHLITSVSQSLLIHHTTAPTASATPATLPGVRDCLMSLHCDPGWALGRRNVQGIWKGQAWTGADRGLVMAHQRLK